MSGIQKTQKSSFYSTLVGILIFTHTLLRHAYRWILLVFLDLEEMFSSIKKSNCFCKLHPPACELWIRRLHLQLNMLLTPLFPSNSNLNLNLSLSLSLSHLLICLDISFTTSLTFMTSRKVNPFMPCCYLLYFYCSIQLINSPYHCQYCIVVDFY